MKVLLREDIDSLGKLGHNLSTEIWWSPNHPFKSSLTGQSANAFAAAYTKAVNKQWTQVIGFGHALFEVGLDVLKRSGDPGSNKAILEALTKTRIDTIVGPVAWGKGPVKNVAKTPLVGGQWRYVDKTFKYDLVVTSNETATNIPLGGEMEPIV